MKILNGHTSPDTAYVVDDYPYGFTLRCRIRYWLEYKPNKGFRFVSQTSNPKRAGIWNKPKASTYCRFGACLYLDDNGHVKWSGLTEYSDAREAKAYLDTYGDGVHEGGQDTLRRWVAAKVAYEANRNPGDALGVGPKEARAAFIGACQAPQHDAHVHDYHNEALNDFNYVGSRHHY